uniref:Uncharacterized protein n=1 Tax=Vitis vinifera TaxID=29760 RepID=A5BX74_VITVI|nr:hypothetical protein VITISV_020990 [Vitis vinifera]
MAPTTAVITYDQGNHAIPAHMTHLVAAPADNISKTSVATPTTPLSKNLGLWALPSHMPSYVAQVANWFILTVTCYVASLPAVLACLIICTVSCNMTLLVAVIAQPQVPRWQPRSWAVSGTMTSLIARMADSLIGTVAGHVTWFSTIPT